MARKSNPPETKSGGFLSDRRISGGLGGGSDQELRWVHGPNGGVADSLNEAKTAFRAAW